MSTFSAIALTMLLFPSPAVAQDLEADCLNSYICVFPGANYTGCIKNFPASDTNYADNGWDGRATSCTLQGVNDQVSSSINRGSQYNGRFYVAANYGGLSAILPRNSRSPQVTYNDQYSSHRRVLP